jgi:hypothetical protein
VDDLVELYIAQWLGSFAFQFFHTLFYRASCRTNTGNSKFFSSVFWRLDHNYVGDVNLNRKQERLLPPFLVSLGTITTIVLEVQQVPVVSFHAESSLTNLRVAGAIYATASYLACKMPRMMFYLYAVIPIPAWAFIPGIFAWEIYSAASGQVNHNPASFCAF